eukprot:gene30346-34384_t
METFDIRASGQWQHMDVVFIAGTPHLFPVDHYSGFMILTRLQSKQVTDVQSVLHMVSSDHEAVFLSCEEFLRMNGVKYHARIPGEHERIAERVDCMNYIPNSRTAGLMPMELVIGERVNYRTDILTLFGQLVLIQHNDVPTSTGIPAGKNEFALALGRVTNTKGSVWVYRMGQTRIVARRPIKAVPFTEEWIAHLNELAAQKPVNPKTMFEFRATLEYGASDKAEDLFE